MEKIVLKVRVSVKERLSRSMRRCRDASTRLRFLMIFNVLHGRSARQTAEVLKVHHTTVGRVVEKFRHYGERDCTMVERTMATISSAKIICNVCIAL
jgi:transposase